MNTMAYLKAHPLRTGLFLMAIYFIYFVIPSAFDPTSFGRGHGTDTAADMGKELFSEIGLSASILLVVAIFSWWKPCGFTLKFNEGGLKFVLLPLVFTTLIIVFAAFTAQSDDQSIVGIVGVGSIATLIVVTLLVGLFEETLFRGVVFMGWEQRYGPILAVFVSALFFGSFHFVNWVSGQPFDQTLTQVIHAFYIGIMYAALRLRIGSIIPVILLHGFWDTAVSIMGSANASLAAHAAKAITETPADGSSVIMLLFSLIEPAYGVFVLWRWHVWQKSKATP